MASHPDLTSEQCREEAEQCKRLAAHAMSGPHRIMLEHIAQTWLRIAAEIDEN